MSTRRWAGTARRQPAAAQLGAEAGLAGAKGCITRYGGTQEYFGEHATYLEPGSEESILNSVKQTMARKKDSALRERIRENYLWPRAGEILAAIYKTATQN